MTQELVILGGNFAGFVGAKTVLDKINPKLGQRAFHVTLISASTHAYFNVGAPRLLVEPDKIDSTLFSIEKAFAKYPKSQFTFIQGTVTNVDTTSQSISYQKPNQTVATASYDSLIIATGARTENVSYKLVGSHEETVDAVKTLNNAVKAAKTIAIGGGGPTGVETAGELSSTYPSKKVTLYTGASRPLEHLGKLGGPAEKKLVNLGVKVINNVKVLSASATADGKTTLKLSDGSESVVDLYIPVVGVRANTEFLDSSFLDKSGFVVTDDNLRVKGLKHVYALGDVISGTAKTVIDLDKAQKQVIEATLLNEHVSSSNKLIPHPHPKEITAAVPISKNGGVGVVNGWGLPSFLVKFAKAKDYMIPKAPGLFGIA
ncbi:hypothetical protein AWJ20_1389 [Sugiyamaella lignohabitans]|uniref:FAD/NAD(P)-binding domain-containing protein n=1 Tax=Sugiyamaella lignohabitans TaxID=796027 RepID=A0A167DNK8_9ASCO|nr:uncharacterized protein AWJ20_1389 [Sugiyamaella lignohabitans]ANB13109.1 hypothetical protein AWJ20_1389 [Sugiyamaella lignohabitans]